MVLISTLIPSFNRATTIEQAIASVQAAVPPHSEIIISDNCSTDGTQDIVMSMAQKDERIIFLPHSSNAGPIPNWLSCLNHAKGRLIHWLWSDDWVEPGFYTTLLRGMEKSGASVGLSAAKIINTDLGWHHIKYSLQPHPTPMPSDIILRKAMLGFEIPQSPAAALLPSESVRRHFTTNIARTSAIDCNSRAIGCDAIMILGALLDHPFVYCCADPLVNFRHAGDSISVNTDDGLRNAHYGWARSWWARRNRLPRSWSAVDYLRIANGTSLWSLLRGICRGHI